MFFARARAFRHFVVLDSIRHPLVMTDTTRGGPPR